MIYKTFLRIQTETKIALAFEREFKNQNFFSPYKYRMSKEASLEKSVGKELSIEQDKYLKDLYYDKPFPFGRDKLFAYVKENNPEIKLSRRQIDIWLKKQEIHQVHYRKKPLRDHYYFAH